MSVESTWPILSRAFRRISLPQIPRQETFWASAGFESTEESVMLSDAPCRQLLTGIIDSFNIVKRISNQ